MRKLLLWIGLISIPLPLLAQSVQPGTVAIYSDGRVEKLLEVREDSRLWQDGRKRLREYANNPILQLLSYTRFPATQGYTQHLTLGMPENIIPFGSADAARFTLRRDYIEGGHSQ